MSALPVDPGSSGDTQPRPVVRPPATQRPVPGGPAPAAVPLSTLLTWSHVRTGVMGGMRQLAHRGTNRAGHLLRLVRARPFGRDLDPLVDPGDPHAEFAALEIVEHRPRRVRGPAPELRLSLAGASVVRGRRRQALPLPELWLDGAAPVPGRLGPRKAPEVLWEAYISGADSVLQVRGPWLHFAALGLAADWPEPA